MVAIASTLLTAVRLDIFPFEYNGQGVWSPKPGGVVTSAIIAGRNTDQRINQINNSAAAITNVDADFWNSWKAANPASDLLTGGWLFELPA